jgi:hypothetical protein
VVAERIRLESEKGGDSTEWKEKFAEFDTRYTELEKAL